jgi:hypothetical protein
MNEPMIFDADPNLCDIIAQAKAQAEQSGAPVIVVVYNDNRQTSISGISGYNVGIGSSGQTGHNTGDQPLRAPNYEVRQVESDKRIAAQHNDANMIAAPDPIQSMAELIRKRADTRTIVAAQMGERIMVSRIMDAIKCEDRGLVEQALKKIW